MQISAALAAITAALPSPEDRPGQRQMAQAVANEINRLLPSE